MLNIPTKNPRIEVADVLRGFAIMGIIILHSVEHFNFYSYPDALPFRWFAFTDRAIWDGLFFAFGGKAYAIFALLFGFSFFIQDDNSRRRGSDFRLRFLWRLVLLFIIGNLNAAFFTAEILVMYSILGIVLVLTCRLGDRVVFALAALCLIQPVELYNTAVGLLNPDATAPASKVGYYFGRAFEAQSGGTFWQTVKVNLWEGQLASLTWAWEHGRIFQTAGLFLAGMLAGRRGYFIDSPRNVRLWLAVFGWAVALYFPIAGLTGIVPSFIDNPLAAGSLGRLLASLSNLALTLMLVNGILVLYYHTRLRGLFHKLAPYGKLSLTHYLGQSVVGAFLFYNWGLGLQLGITYSFLVGIALFLAQYAFSVWWLKRHTHGPFEGLWKKLTWIGRKH